MSCELFGSTLVSRPKTLCIANVGFVECVVNQLILVSSYAVWHESCWCLQASAASAHQRIQVLEGALVAAAAENEALLSMGLSEKLHLGQALQEALADAAQHSQVSHDCMHATVFLPDHASSS